MTSSSYRFFLKLTEPFFSIVLYKYDSGEMLDKIEYNSSNFGLMSERIIVLTDYRYLNRLIQEGENSQVEFKGFANYNEISKNKVSFLSSVLSFANTNGGQIIIGVKDNKEIIGFKDQRSIEKLIDDITKLIDGNCESIIEFKLELVDMQNQNSLLL